MEQKEVYFMRRGSHDTEYFLVAKAPPPCPCCKHRKYGEHVADFYTKEAAEEYVKLKNGEHHAT